MYKEAAWEWFKLGHKCNYMEIGDKKLRECFEETWENRQSGRGQIIGKDFDGPIII